MYLVIGVIVVVLVLGMLYVVNCDGWIIMVGLYFIVILCWFDVGDRLVWGIKDGWFDMMVITFDMWSG